MIRFTEGDIFDANHQIIVNPINCIGVMGKGLALEFKKRYPDNFAAYKEVCKENKLNAGDILPFILQDGRIIINFATKFHYAHNSKILFINRGLQQMTSYIINNIESNKLIIRGSIGIPALGCGLGGLNWELVRKSMVTYLSYLPDYIDIFIYNPKEKC